MLDNTNNMADLQDQNVTRHFAEGMPVYDVSGDKIGTISETPANSSNLVIQKGLFFPHDYTVPMNAVARADESGVYLNVTKDDVTNQRFDTLTNDAAVGAPAEPFNPSAPVRNLDMDVNNQRGSYAQTAPQETITNRQGHATPLREGDIAVPVREEELNVGKERGQAGAVHLHKDVYEEQQAVNVPVSHEEVRVEHVPVQGDAATDLGPDTFVEKDIDVPLMAEQAVVNKEARVTDEVHLHKQTVTENQRVADTVRKERVTVEGGDNVENANNPAYDQTLNDNTTTTNRNY